MADRVQHVIRGRICCRRQATHFDSVSTVFIGCWLYCDRCICQRYYIASWWIVWWLSYTWTFVPLSNTLIWWRCYSLLRIFPISLLCMMHIHDNFTTQRCICRRRQVSCRLTMLLLMCMVLRLCVMVATLVMLLRSVVSVRGWGWGRAEPIVTSEDRRRWLGVLAGALVVAARLLRYQTIGKSFSTQCIDWRWVDHLLCYGGTSSRIIVIHFFWSSKTKQVYLIIELMTNI